LIPLVAADYLARQLPRFWLHAARIVPAISDPFALGWNLFGTAHSSLYNTHLLSLQGVIASQVLVVGLGTAAALFATWRIVRRDLRRRSSHPAGLALASAAVVILCGAGIALLYLAMGGAQ
jgi:hypothetical protein